MDREEDFSCDLTLESYLEAICHDESLIQSFDEREADSAKRRGQVLDHAVKKFAFAEIKGKPYVQEYMRSVPLLLQPQHHPEQLSEPGNFSRVLGRRRPE
jgi:hypothetical protein